MRYLFSSQMHICEQLPRHAAYKAARAGGLLDFYQVQSLFGMGILIIYERATESMKCNARNKEVCSKVRQVTSKQLFACTTASQCSMQACLHFVTTVTSLTCFRPVDEAINHHHVLSVSKACAIVYCIFIIVSCLVRPSADGMHSSLRRLHARP